MKVAILDPWDLASIKPKPQYAGATRAQIVSWAQHLFRSWYGEPEPDAGQCLHWAHVGCCVLRLCGMRSVLQAGDMNWPINRNAPFPAPTHFTFAWEPWHPSSRLRIIQGGLPEVHAWVALPDQNEIVDFSTFSFRQQAEKRHGLIWADADPPEYLWAKVDALPSGVRYWARVEAIKFVAEFLNRAPIPMQPATA